MCQSNVYIERGGRQELLLEDVALIYPDGGDIVLMDLFGEQRSVPAAIKRIDLMGHKILLEERSLDELPEPLRQAKGFHSHLGPNLTLGIRMGRIITDRLGDRPFSYTIISYTGKTPPISCLIDGLQLSTPCTVGNGGIKIVDGGQAHVIASDREGKAVEIRVRPDIMERIEREFDQDHEEVLPLAFWEMPDEELFEVNER